MIPKESEGECFEDALARVCRIGGGTATNNADSDSDLEVVADYFGVNLRCPVSYSSELLVKWKCMIDFGAIGYVINLVSAVLYLNLVSAANRVLLSVSEYKEPYFICIYRILFSCEYALFRFKMLRNCLNVTG